MSFNLPDVDLTGATAGMTGKILLQNMGISAGGISANPSGLNTPATLYFFNESGAGLGMTCKDSGESFNLPAGAWALIPIKPGESEIDYYVKYTLPQPPVNTLMITYYAPGEDVPQTHTLGNSPVNGGTAVSGNTLSNESNTAGFEVIDIGTPGNPKALDIFNDHFLWNVIQSGVLHQVLKGQASGNPLQIGQAGDTTEVLGGLLVDANLHTTSQLVVDAVPNTGAVAPPTGTGTAELYEQTFGPIKLVIVELINYQNTSATSQTLVLPTPILRSWLVLNASSMINMVFLRAGTPLSFEDWTSLGSSSSGGNAPETVHPSAAIGNTSSTNGHGTMDTIRLSANNTNVHDGILVLIGI